MDLSLKYVKMKALVNRKIPVQQYRMVVEWRVTKEIIPLIIEGGIPGIGCVKK